MLRIAAAALLLAAPPAFAQQAHSPGGHGHAGATSQQSVHAEARKPAESGQSAFAAIQEIVQILEADPRTDWSKVSIEALRQHLIDMNNVTLGANVTAEPIGSGVRFTALGAGSVRDSIRRMVSAHAAAMNGVEGWKFTSADVDGGALLTLEVPAADLQKVRALGFIGVMAHGMHHQAHHLSIARGGHPHG